MRSYQRQNSDLRPIEFIKNYTKHAEGSVLIKCGDTHILCNCSIEESVPSFLRGKGQGWVTAEYGMLPRSTSSRMPREAAKGKQSGRTQEIQRLIGRSLRAILDLKKLGERTIHVDCDVIQADGGTRTASISGAYVAIYDAIQTLIDSNKISTSPLINSIAAISVGIKNGEVFLDLDYEEDSSCDTDMNIVMTGNGEFVEIQGTAEGVAFSRKEMDNLINMAASGIKLITQKQTEAIGI